MMKNFEEKLPQRFRTKKKKLEKPVIVQIRYCRKSGNLFENEWEDYTRHRSVNDAKKYIDKEMRGYNSVYGLFEMRIKNDKTP